MRIYFYIIAMAFALLQFTSCQEEELDRNSIFTDEPTTEKNSFDQWLKKNYTDTYNIKLIYRLEDMEPTSTIHLHLPISLWHRNWPKW